MPIISKTDPQASLHPTGKQLLHEEIGKSGNPVLLSLAPGQKNFKPKSY